MLPVSVLKPDTAIIFRSRLDQVIKRKEGHASTRTSCDQQYLGNYLCNTDHIKAQRDIPAGREWHVKKNIGDLSVNNMRGEAFHCAGSSVII